MDDRLNALFVTTGGGLSSGDGSVTIHDVAAATVFFAEHPRREAGHVPTARFVELWADGFEPSAVISFVEGPPDAVVVLRDPHIDGGTLTFSAELVDGTLPAEAGPCAVFVDALDQPLEPVLAPAARRVRRRN